MNKQYFKTSNKHVENSSIVFHWMCIKATGLEVSIDDKF